MIEDALKLIKVFAQVAEKFVTMIQQHPQKCALKLW